MEKMLETVVHGMEETIVPKHTKKMLTSEEETTFIQLEKDKKQVKTTDKEDVKKGQDEEVEEAGRPDDSQEESHGSHGPQPQHWDHGPQPNWSYEGPWYRPPYQQYQQQYHSRPYFNRPHYGRSEEDLTQARLPSELSSQQATFQLKVDEHYT